MVILEVINGVATDYVRNNPAISRRRLGKQNSRVKLVK